MANIDVEGGLRNFRDFLSVYNQMSESCFNRCIINLNQRNLSEEEKACTDVCAEKQMKYNNRLMSVYMREQPIATERKMKEAATGTLFNLSGYDQVKLRSCAGWSNCILYRKLN